MDSLLRRELARFFDDPSGGKVWRDDENKTILYVPELPGAPQALFVKVYHYSRWSTRLRVAWRRLGALHDMRIAQRLSGAGIGVPEPVAALVQRNAFGLVDKSLYAAQWLPETATLTRVIRDAKMHRGIDAAAAGALIAVVGGFVRKLHEDGVRSKDLNSGNLLVRVPDPGRFELFLVDYEHVRFIRSVPFEIRLRNLTQIGVDLTSIVEDGERLLCEAYAQSDDARGVDALVREVSDRIKRKRLSQREALDKRFAVIYDAARTHRNGTGLV